MTCSLLHIRSPGVYVSFKLGEAEGRGGGGVPEAYFQLIYYEDLVDFPVGLWSGLS